MESLLRALDEEVTLCLIGSDCDEETANQAYAAIDEMYFAQLAERLPVVCLVLRRLLRLPADLRLEICTGDKGQNTRRN